MNVMLYELCHLSFLHDGIVQCKNCQIILPNSYMNYHKKNNCIDSYI